MEIYRSKLLLVRVPELDLMSPGLFCFYSTMLGWGTFGCNISTASLGTRIRSGLPRGHSSWSSQSFRHPGREVHSKRKIQDTLGYKGEKALNGLEGMGNGLGGSAGKSSRNKNAGMAGAKEPIPGRPRRFISSSLGGPQERQGPSLLAFREALTLGSVLCCSSF